jgi:hypothetical protein
MRRRAPGLAEETGWNDIALLGEVHRRTLTMEYAE